MNTTRYHLTTVEQISEYAGVPTRSNIIQSDGTFLALVDLDHSEFDIDFVEECMENDENIVSYRAEDINL